MMVSPPMAAIRSETQSSWSQVDGIGNSDLLRHPLKAIVDPVATLCLRTTSSAFPPRTALCSLFVNLMFFIKREPLGHPFTLMMTHSVKHTFTSGEAL